MSNLEEDLRELADLLPGLPGEAMSASQSAAALIAAATPLAGEIEAVDEVADEIVAVASKLGQAFAKHANDLEQHLRDTLAEVPSSWEAAAKAVESAAEGTFASALTLFQAKGTLLAALEPADEAIDPTEQAEAATESLAAGALEAQRGVSTESEELQQLATAYIDVLADRVPRINAATEALKARVDELHDRIEQGAGTLVVAMAEKARELDEALRQTLATFVAALEDQRTLSADHLREQVGPPLAEAGDAANQSLAALGTGVESRDRRLIEVRAQFGQAFADLDEAARLVPVTIQEIHEAFERVDGL
jgi:uncharacterized phage infection (PIP) family protein YhgE